jgi:imidazoleglycerol-phosphate dehydratase
VGEKGIALRTYEKNRETRETLVKVQLNLDGTGASRVNTPVLFLNHMLTSLSTHSMIDITVEASGDLSHHIVEDVALVLGDALRGALGDAHGVTRFSSAAVPMDESLAEAVLDLSGRPYSVISLGTRGEWVENMACEDASHFLQSLASSARITLHINVPYGTNDHHRIEAAFKALALCLREAVRLDPLRVGAPSSKGVL